MTRIATHSTLSATLTNTMRAVTAARPVPLLLACTLALVYTALALLTATPAHAQTTDECVACCNNAQNCASGETCCGTFDTSSGTLYVCCGGGIQCTSERTSCETTSLSTLAIVMIALSCIAFILILACIIRRYCCASVTSLRVATPQYGVDTRDNTIDSAGNMQGAIALIGAPGVGPFTSGGPMPVAPAAVGAAAAAGAPRIDTPLLSAKPWRGAYS